MSGYYLGSPYVTTIVGSIDARATSGCKATSTVPEPRPHDQHCADCDSEEFAGVKYGTYHKVVQHA